jgi:hypothetical protein
LAASKPDPDASETAAEPPVSADFSNAVVRAVITCLMSHEIRKRMKGDLKKLSQSFPSKKNLIKNKKLLSYQTT